MPAEPVKVNAYNVDMSGRWATTSVVAGSPALAAETVIATLTIPQNAAVISGIQLWGWCAFTVGTSGVSANLRIKQTNTSGSAINVGTGLTTVTAANLVETGVQGFDTAPTLPNQVYVLTLIVTSGAAISTVSAVQLSALIV